jgi:ribosomal protein L16 Arg81 hydroxylase
MQISFEWLIQPCKPSVFFSEYYERKPLVVQRNDPAHFVALLSVAAIDRFLATTSPCHPDVFVVDAARKLTPEDYVLPGTDGELDLPRVYQLFESGATISIRHLHEKVPELAALCRVAEKVFSAHFQTNIYLSPPNAQGFKTHYDTHDVFVLQVAGSKRWTLNDTLIELPLHGQRFDSAQHVSRPPTREFTLRAGDLLYCPRGQFHSARSSNELSLHITLGLIGKTWADVLMEALVSACLSSPAFRANLPAGFAYPGFDTTEAKRTFRSLIDQFAHTAELEPILGRFAEEFVVSRRPDVSGLLEERRDAPAVALDTAVQPRANLIYRLDEVQGKVSLLFGPTTITFPSEVHEALRFALIGPAFTPGDLPGRLDDAGKIVLVRRLIKEGLLVRSLDVAPFHQKAP